jgi:hypothetical protein
MVQPRHHTQTTDSHEEFDLQHRIDNQPHSSHEPPAAKPSKGKDGTKKGKMRDLCRANLGAGEVVVLDHVAEHDEHGEREEARRHLPRIHRH